MTEPAFRRALGPWSAGALIAGSMIGTGIFFFVADVAAVALLFVLVNGAYLAILSPSEMAAARGAC